MSETSPLAALPDPGDWDWGPMDDGACVYAVKGAQTETVAFLYSAHGQDRASLAEERARMQAYARLMAGAPNLLAALKALLDANQQGRTPTAQDLDAAHEAVQRACNE